ncbi:TPA: hypothetical protein I7245_14095 [Vibrio vulnificus]|nr:hypothetical protein [Vibrio vulnificus]HDY7583821.1 hypothetical protein [Vibrio vulnificus]HDY8011818.1 hypothetical protein [Vibrio vulnificus]
MPRWEIHLPQQPLKQTNSSNCNTAVAIPTHYTRRTMGPRIREDDELRERNSSVSDIKKELGFYQPSSLSG